MTFHPCTRGETTVYAVLSFSRGRPRVTRRYLPAGCHNKRRYSREEGIAQKATRIQRWHGQSGLVPVLRNCERGPSPDSSLLDVGGVVDGEMMSVCVGCDELLVVTM